MRAYVVERRLPNLIASDLATLKEALAFACDRLAARGEPVRCLGSAYLPGTGRLLTLFEAEREEAVRLVNVSAHAPFQSIEAAVKIDPATAASWM